MEARARAVHREYERHAERLDRRLYGAHSTTVLDHLHSFGHVRGLAVGHYAEASPDVHELVDICADRSAAMTWRAMGARSQTEARSFYVVRYRRDLGVAFALAHVQHRTRREPQVGLSHDAVREFARRRGGPTLHDVMERHHGGMRVAPAEFYAAQPFLGHEVHALPVAA